jgi:hypothetical protein
MQNYFDIETVPQPKALVERMFPGSITKAVMPDEIANPVMPEFTNATLKDPVKIADWLAGKQEKWAADSAAAQAEWHAKLLDAKMKFHENAALSATTGVIALVPLLTKSGVRLYANCEVAKLDKVKFAKGVVLSKCADEKNLIEALQQEFADSATRSDCRWIGFSTSRFDLPFIIQRCFLLGIPLRRYLTQWLQNKFALWHSDVQLNWMAHRYADTFVSQDDLCRAFDLPTKPGDGALFWQMLRDEPQRAVDYAIHDIRTVRELALRTQMDT